MITAIDTNILLDILLPNERLYGSSAAALEDSATTGALVICDMVYGELCIHFETQRDCDTFLESNDIHVQPLNRRACFLAGRAWRTYRRQGGKRNRILPDFLIAAHASEQAHRLLSRDRGFYRELFPALKLYDPTE